MKIIVTEQQILSLKHKLKENNNYTNIIYSGVFVNSNELKEKYPPIYENEFYHHTTIEFKPKDVSDFPVGKKVNLKIVGRLTTDKVDVLLVESPLSKNNYPHITLSTNTGVKPFESNSEIENNVNKIKKINDTIYGVYGLFNGKDVIKENTTIEGPYTNVIPPVTKVNSGLMQQIVGEGIDSNHQYVYHASKNEINKIIPYSEYKNNKSGYYPGMYFFNSKDVSKMFYDPKLYHIYRTDISGLKLYDNKDGDELKRLASKNGAYVNGGSGYNEAKWLEEVGYDGMIRASEIILFQPEKLNIEKVDINLEEDINLDVNVGDTVMMGKFKNKKTVVKKIDKDKHGSPTINGKQATTFRLINDIKKEVVIEEDNRLKIDKNKLLGQKFYHGTIMETWDKSNSDYLFIVSDFEVAKNHAIDRANSMNLEYSKPFTAIVVEIIITNKITSLLWLADDDNGNWSGSPFNYNEWYDSYENVGSFIIKGDYDINDFKIVYKKIFTNQNLNEVTSDEVSLASFKPQPKLNEKIWKSENVIKPNVRKRLLKIADDFLEYINVDQKFCKDILFLGSLANYNWSKYSDFDLHLLVDFKKINDDVELVKNYFDAKKKLWSAEHETLNIFNYPVELYVQDVNEANAATGVYSLEKNKWVKKPSELKDLDLDKSKIKNKAADLMTKIDDLYNSYKNKKSSSEMEQISKSVKTLYDKIKKLRKSGLETEDGEFSVGNIVFKVLRRSGHLEKLIELKGLTYDKLNSIK